MWSRVVSADKKYVSEMNKVLGALKEINWATCAAEESNNRIFIVAAVPDALAAELDLRLENLFADLYLSSVKFAHLKQGLKVDEFTHTTVSLMAAMLGFDLEVERAAVYTAIRECGEFNFDAILNFRLKDLRRNWQDLTELCNNLLALSDGDDDIFYAASFIASAPAAEKNRLLIYKINNSILIKNLISGRQVEKSELYDNEEFNVLTAVLLEKPNKITVEGVEFSDNMLSTLKRFGGVKKGIM